jgi:RNA polymerase sigma-70 factor (ECF subfamily)
LSNIGTKPQDAGTGGATDVDARLVRVAREGDRIAFDRIVLKYRDPIVGLCVRLLGDYADGEDAAQEVFVKVYRNIASFKGDSLFSTWIYRIAVNTCRNRQTSWWARLRKRAVRLDGEPESDGGRPAEIADTSMSPEKDLERRRTAEAITRGLRALPRNHRELIVLRDVQGLSYEEIERVTGLAEGTVKSRLARARTALRNELKGLVNGH